MRSVEQPADDLGPGGSAALPGDTMHRDQLLSGGDVRLLAIIVGVAIANGYYVQPLINIISRSIGLSHFLWGLLASLTQFGLATGLLILLPLADIVPARRLMTMVMIAQVAALALVGLSTGPFTMLLGCFAVGFFGICPYLIPSYASTRTRPDRVADVTGSLIRGVIIGILLARTVSGLIASHLGWRTVYGVAAVGTMLALLVALRVVRPTRASISSSYRNLLASMVSIARTTRSLQRAAAVQAASFGCFNSFWVGSVLYLHQRFGWTPDRIGLVGLIAAVAASVAPAIASLSRRLGAETVRLMSAFSSMFSWALLVLFRDDLPVMGIALVILDIACAVTDIANRTILYREAPEIRGRLSAVYTIAMFIGGGLLSLVTGMLWSVLGWPGVCLAGILSSALAFAIALVARGGVLNQRSRA